MKIGIMSDLHMEFDVTAFGPTEQFDFEKEDDVFYIVAGDIDSNPYLREQFLQKVDFHVLGNHDYYGNMFGSSRMEVEKDGIKIAGATLWTEMKNPMDWVLYYQGLNDSRYIDNLNEFDYVNTHKDDLDFLINSGADVIVSHHSPSLKSIADKYQYNTYNGAYHSDYEELIQMMVDPPKLWIHGHTHEEFDYMIGETRIICHPRGYPHEDTYFGYKPKIVEVESGKKIPEQESDIS